MKKLKLTFGLIAAVCICNGASADWTGNMTVHELYAEEGGSAVFGVSTTPANTCSYFGERFIFDSTTNAGKSLLSILLSAKLTNRTISVWYHPATATGNETNGCNLDTLARVFGIAIH